MLYLDLRLTLCYTYVTIVCKAVSKLYAFLAIAIRLSTAAAMLKYRRNSHPAIAVAVAIAVISYTAFV